MGRDRTPWSTNSLVPLDPLTVSINISQHCKKLHLFFSLFPLYWESHSSYDFNAWVFFSIRLIIIARPLAFYGKATKFVFKWLNLVWRRPVKSEFQVGVEKPSPGTPSSSFLCFVHFNNAVLFSLYIINLFSKVFFSFIVWMLDYRLLYILSLNRVRILDLAKTCSLTRDRITQAHSYFYFFFC